MLKILINCKKAVAVLMGIMMISSLFATVSFYGLLRTGAWYTLEDKDFTGGNTITELTSSLYGTSKIGAKFTKDKFNAKVELGYSNANAVFLRLAYAEYDFGKISLMFGQNYSGFTSANYSFQASSTILSTSGLGNIGYGAFYDGRQPMLKLTYNKSLYLILMQPKKSNPANINEDSIDTLLPKLNFGFNYVSDKLSIFPTFGINYSKYNKNNNATNIDNRVISYAFATTFKIKLENLCIKTQVNYGQNIGDYGITTISDNYKATFNATDNQVVNSTAMGGYVQLAYMMNLGKIIAGTGYTSVNNDNLNSADTALDAFLQMNIKVAPKIYLTPEIGYINLLKNGMDVNEGSIKYFGTRLQASF